MAYALLKINRRILHRGESEKERVEKRIADAKEFLNTIKAFLKGRIKLDLIDPKNQ